MLPHRVLLQLVWDPEGRRGPVAQLVRDVVKRLRRKRGDSAEAPMYIIAEPHVGYRMAKVEGQELQAP